MNKHRYSFCTKISSSWRHTAASPQHLHTVDARAVHTTTPTTMLSKSVTDAAQPVNLLIIPKNVTRGKNKAIALTPERFGELSKQTITYSDSTLKKHKWSLGLYASMAISMFFRDPSHRLDFVQMASALSGISALWPLDPAIIAAFIRFHGIDCGYKPESLENVVIPSLQRMHKDNTGSLVSGTLSHSLPLSFADSVKLAIKAAMHDVRKQGNRQLHCREPSIASDVRLIIDSTPLGHPRRNCEASLYLVALSTGARAMTMEGGMA